MPSSTQLRGDLLVLAAASIWGVAFYFQKTAMLHIEPLLFIGLRGAVAAATLLPFAIHEQRVSRTQLKHISPIALLAGALFFIAGIVQQYGIVTASVINTGFLTALYVVVTPLAFWAVKRQAPKGHIWATALIAFIGVWCLGGGALEGLSTGDLLVASSAIVWALMIVVSGEAAQHNRPLTYTCIQFATVAVISLPLAMMFEPLAWPAIQSAGVAILYVGVLSSALTFAMMATALRHISAPRASILLSSEVVFSAAAGYWFLDERLAPIGWLGGALILGAVVSLRLFDRRS